MAMPAPQLPAELFVKPGRYARYLRKSRADLKLEKEGQFETLAKHEADTDEFCAAQGYVIHDDYRELVSGESISERKEFQKLMAGVQRGEYAGVVVHAVDRLGRGDIADYGWVLSTFQMTGTLIITPQRTYDPRDFGDFLALVLLMIISSAELSNTKRRYKEGKERNIKNGQYIASHAPYGYSKVVDDNERHTLVANEYAARVIYIYNTVALGVMTTTKLARKFNEEKIPPPQNGGAWKPRVIKRMIRNKIYKGVVEWGNTATEMEPDENGYRRKVRRRQKNPSAQGTGIHEPLVSEEIWQAANDRIVSNEKVKTSTELQNPLAGILVCAKCGARVRSIYSPQCRQRRYYHERFSTCEGWKGCNEDVVLDLVVEMMKAMVGEIEVRVKSGETESKMHEKELKGLYADLESVDRKYRKLMDLYLDDNSRMGKEMLRERQTELEESKDGLVRRISQLEAKKPVKLDDVTAKLSDIIETMKDPSVSAEIKNTMLKQVFATIEMDNLEKRPGKNDVRLTFKMKDL